MPLALATSICPAYLPRSAPMTLPMSFMPAAPIICSPLIPAKAGIHPTNYTSDMFWTPASAGVSGVSLSRRQLGLHHAAGLGHVHLPGVFTAQRADDLAHVLHAGGADNMLAAHSRESGNPPNKLYQRYVLDPRLRGGERRFTVTRSASPSPCRWPWPRPSARRIYMAGRGGADNMLAAHSRGSGNPPNRLYQRCVLDLHLRGGERRFTVTRSASPSPCRWPWPCPSARHIYRAARR